MKAAALYLLALLLLGGLISFGAAVTIGRIEEKAASAAREERDAHWWAEIAKSNAEYEQALRHQADKAHTAELQARDTIADLERQNTALEKDNDALPDDGRCGLSRSRVQLLNR